MVRNYERGELAKEILKAFLVGGLVISCVAFPGMAHILKLFNTGSAGERSRVRRAVQRLEKKGLLIRKIKNGKEIIEVTQAGKSKISEYIVDELYIQRPKKWDKKWRVLMFDIPETKARVRREVSFRIRDMGMVAIQDSVFLSPFPCKQEVDFLADHYFVREYFIYFEADTIECKEDVLKIFKLNK